MKAPEFMETAVNRWFTILEAQFPLQNVTAPKTKFYTIVSPLPAVEIAELPNATLVSQDYGELKQTLIESHKRMKPKLFEKWMLSVTISGRPSAYLHEILSVAKEIGISKAQISPVTAINNISSNCLAKRL